VLALATERTVERVLGLAAARFTHRLSRAAFGPPLKTAGHIPVSLHNPRQPTNRLVAELFDHISAARIKICLNRLTH
jgi:hypothetical protein